MVVPRGWRFCLLTLAAIFAACACGRTRPSSEISPVSVAGANEVKVEVAKIGFDEAAGAHVILLKEQYKDRVLPILVGEGEAQAIMLVMHGIKPPRPLTHDLLRSVIEQTGNRIDRIEITEVRDEVYFAKIYLDQGRYAIDSRPSDAIALAVGAGAPIFVATSLLQAPNPEELEVRGTLPATARALGMTVEDLTPDLARYFNVPRRSGVLVADVADPARQAGVERGDIITKVGTRDIKAVGDFSESAAAAKNAASVTVSIKRAGADRTVTIKP
ncbi:MAG TPA: bifunctional nuclease domain-containing protein [Candidatus Binataceae bacterium]|nr:bifunctional nuclease domain-containing protein [Candidatus Binataceae bacterium]